MTGDRTTRVHYPSSDAYKELFAKLEEYGMDDGISSLSAVLSLVEKKGDGLVWKAIEAADYALRSTFDPVTAAAAAAFAGGVTEPRLLDRAAGAGPAELLDKLSELSKLERVRDPEAQVNQLRRMLVAMAGDVRVVVLKLVQVLLDLKPSSGRRKKPVRNLTSQARLCMALYAPLAHRLGMAWLKAELEDSAFSVLEPKKYRSLNEKLEKTRKEREKVMDEVKRDLLKALASRNPPVRAVVYGRLKHLYSIQRKLEAQNIQFEQVMDIVAFRILVDSVDECYAALGLIHGMWVPVLGRFKDWIAMPKPNGYRSLHTTVLHPKCGRIEIQIRTHEMHKVAEEGLAAHWRYKEGGRSVSPERDDVKIPWLSKLVKEMEQARGSKEVIETVEHALLPDVVYVFTPQGDVKELPKGSTPVDFAYAVHSEVGHHCVGAKIDGRIVPLRYVLKNGDQVEVQTHPRQQPREDWLTFVRTPRARQKIRQRISAERRARAREIGRELLEKALKAEGLNLSRMEKKGEVTSALEHEPRFRTADDLVLAIGTGKLSVDQALDLLVQDRKASAAKKQVLPAQDKRREGKRPGLKLGGLDDLLVRYARCCSPVAGDEVVGFVTRGRGVTIHRADCPRLAELEPARKIDVEWDLGSGSGEEGRLATIFVKAKNRIGMLANISKVFKEANIDIVSSTSRVLDGGAADLTFTVRTPNADRLKAAMKKARRISGVKSVVRRLGNPRENS